MSTDQTTAWTGLPLNPEVSGWHWLRYVGAHGLSPWYWDANDEVWDADDDHRYCGQMALSCEYVAACPYPESATNG